MLNTLTMKCPRRFQNFSVWLCIALAKKAGRDSDEIFVYYVGTGFGKPWHFAEGYDLFCLTVETTCFT